LIEWQHYEEWNHGAGHTVSGTVRVLPDLYSPQLDNRRHLLVYLPPAYAAETDRRFPVIYMHDGQNLFDAATGYAGEWRVDETLNALAGEGVAAIVVGLPNLGAERANEYTPFPDRRMGQGGKGRAYVDFIVQTVKPLIDDAFRTLPDRAHTGVMGSSLGGLISLAAFFQHPHIFGLAGVMSPALWFGGEAILASVRQAPFSPGRIYMDVGTAEVAPPKGIFQFLPFLRRYYRTDSQRMHRELIRKGYVPGQTLLYVEEEGGQHNEAAWAKRLPGAFRFLLG